MADDNTPAGGGFNNPMNLLSAVGMGDLNTTLKISNQNISQLINVIQAIFPRTFGTFTMAAAATTTVTQPAVQSGSYIVPVPLNAAAATLQGSVKNIYVSAKTPGASFVFSTANGTNATGTEQFAYFILNPV